MVTNLGTAVGYLSLDITGFTRGIDEATRQIDRMGNTGTSSLDRFGTAATKAGTLLTATVTAPVIGFGASILKEGTTFEEGMTHVKNVAKLANSDINDFREAVASLGYDMVETGDDAESMYKTMYNYAIRQGSETRYTAEEVSQALYYMGLAGWKASDMMRGLRPVLDLSAASGEDLARVSDIVTDSMTALKIPITDLSTYTNTLAEMTRSSNTTLDQAGEAFKYVAPLAGAMGYNMQDVAIAIGEFANVGVKGSQAGTGLRQAINSLTNPSQRAQEVLDRLNWSIYDLSTGKAKPLHQVMTELRSMFRVTDELDSDAWSAFSEYLDEAGKAEEFDESSVSEQMKLVSEWASTAGVNGEKLTTQYQKISDVLKLVGIRALPGMLGIINAEEDSFNALTQSIYSANEAYDGMGTSSGMASELMNTTQGSIYKLTSSLSELKIQLFDLLQGPFQGLVNKLTDAVKWFNSLDKETQQSMLKFAGIAAAIGPALLVIGKLATGISQLKTAFGIASLSKDKFSKNVTGTLAPALGKGEKAAAGLAGNAGIGGISLSAVAVVAVIAALIAAFVHLMLTNEEFRGKITEIWNGVVQKFNEACSKIVEAINSLGFNFKDLGEAIYAAWDWMCNQLAPVLEALFVHITTLISGFIDIVAGYVQVICGIIKGFKDGDWSLFVEGLKSIWDGFWTLALSPITTVFHLWDELLGGALSNWSDVWTAIENIFTNVWNGIASFFTYIWGCICDIFNAALEIISSAVESALDFILNTVSAILTGISNLISDILNAISSLISTALDTIKNIIDTVLNAISNIFSTVWETIKTVVSNVCNAIISTVKEVFSALKSFIETIMQSILSLIQHIWTSIKDFTINIWNAIKDAITNVINTIKNFIQSAMQAIHNTIQSIWNNIKNFISTTIDSIKSKVTSTVTAMKDAVINIFTSLAQSVINKAKEIHDGIVNAFSNIKSKMESVGSDIVNGIWNGLKSGWDWLKNKVKGLCDDLVSAAKSALQIGSPSKVFADKIGHWLPPGIAEGFEDGMPEAEEDMAESLDDMIDNINKENHAITVGTAYSDLQSLLGDTYSTLADSVETTEERLVNSIDRMYEKMYNLLLLEQQINADGTIDNTGYGTTNTTTPIGGAPVNGAANTGSGNTFIFNSPKPIDEIEAARQMEKTQREIEEGFI